jgi:tetratricopeptide (TPR) repeat protein
MLYDVSDEAVPPIARATAISLLQRYVSPDVLANVERSLSDADPLVRRAAVTLLDEAPPAIKLRLLPPLLADPIRSVRLATAFALAGAPGLDASRDHMLKSAVDEARASLRDNADRADARVELANLEARLGRRDLAERELREALELQRTFVPAYVNLADLLRLEGRHEESVQLLERGLMALPDSAMLQRALGLALVRRGQVKVAVAHLAKSAELAPDDPMAAYVWAVALHGTGDARGAIRILTSAASRFPGHEPTQAASRAYGDPRR